MNLQTHGTMVADRFAKLLGDHSNSACLFDRPLLETDSWVAAPTLGAILPNWLIVVPRHAALNYRSWQRATGRNPASIVRNVGTHLDIPVEQLLWFEHGPRDAGTSVGCGVDYAHLHILYEPVFTLHALMDRVRMSAQLAWHPSVLDGAYDGLSDDKSYLIVGSGSAVFVAEGVEATGSQFLRRMVAETVGLDSDWDYNRYPHHENIALTVKTFRERARGVVTGG